MVAILRRTYLYFVASVALIFVIYALSNILTWVLYTLNSALLPAYELPPGTSIGTTLRQATVLLVVALVIVAPIGALHYWLIDREGLRDPQTLGDGVRAVFLTLLIIGFLSQLIQSLGSVAFSLFDSGNLVSFAVDSFAHALADAVALGLLWLESQRSTAPSTAARRGTLLLVGIAQILWLVGAIVASAHALQDALDQAVRALPACTQFNFLNCQYPSTAAAGEVAQAFVYILGFVVLLLWVRHDRASFITQTALAVLVLSATITSIVGVAAFARLVLGMLTGEVDATWAAGIVQVSGNSLTAFVAPLVIGLAAEGGLLAWFISGQLLDVQWLRERILVLMGLIAPLLTIFLVGAAGLLGALLAHFIAGSNSRPDALVGGAQMVAGVVWLAIWPLLTQLVWTVDTDESTAGPAHAPRQARGVFSVLVIALLGISLVTAVIGLAIAVYAVLSAVIGSPLTNGGDIGSRALGVAIPLAASAAYFGSVWWRMRAHLAPQAQPATAPADAPEVPSEETPGELEELLRQVASGARSVPDAVAMLRTRFGARG